MVQGTLFSGTGAVRFQVSAPWYFRNASTAVEQRNPFNVLFTFVRAVRRACVLTSGVECHRGCAHDLFAPAEAHR